ncbi:MAG: heat-inducible transcriptional repressor [Parvibaculaceae bacterium]|jgi:heat-inducible transcriptional repressor
MMDEYMSGLKDLNRRSQDILRQIVETYLETGEPVGSRTLSQNLSNPVSAATVRNVMSDLEGLGLLFAPHTSAGRLPTDAGLRMFVDGLLELGHLSEPERHQIEVQMRGANSSQGLDDILRDASHLLSGLSQCAGLVLAPKNDAVLKHIEFVPVDGTRALVVMVTEDGTVENRVIEVPPGITPSALTEATNYLNARFRGRTVSELASQLDIEIRSQRQELQEITRRLIDAGLAAWAGSEGGPTQFTPNLSSSGSGMSGDTRSLIVTGQSRLLDNVTAMADLEQVRHLFEELENKADLVQLLGRAEQAEGVRIFIGSESKHFGLSGSSVVVSPFRDEKRQIVGVLGVIGPTRLNYAKIIPMVDYTATVISRMIGRET